MRSAFLTILILAATTAFAAEPWTVEDVLNIESASSMELSRDGTQAVWVKSKMDKKKGRSASNLVLRNLAEDFEVQLTRGSDSNRSPRFSPDGKRIAFLSNRKEASGAKGGDAKPTVQVWLIDTRGGEAFKLTSFKKGVKEVHWLDNDNLLVTAAEDPSLYEQEVEKRKDTSNVVDDEKHAPPVRLFRVCVKDKKVTRLTANKDRIFSTFVSDDGAWAVTLHQRSLQYEYNANIRPVTFLHNLKKGTSKQLFTDGKLLPQIVVFTPDGKGFYFTAPYTTDPKYIWGAITLLYYCDVASGQPVKVNLDWERGLGDRYEGSLEVSSEGVLVLAADGVRFKTALYKRNGDTWSRSWVTGKHASNLFGLKWSRDGKTLLYQYSTASKQAQRLSAELNGHAIQEEKQITKLNAGLEKKTMAKTEIVHWKGAKGDEIEGILYYPHHYVAGKRYPLVLSIHGGPHGADMDRFSDRMGYPNNLFAQRGAFVLKPNYHGSSNYGLAWGESISGGHYNDYEWIDCDRGVDAMIARGLVDPEKLGVMGWSNGSIITIEITTHTTRYKVASAGAGDVDWISDWANCQFGDSFDEYYLGTTPLADPQFYLKKSPLFRMDKVRTPTIIFFGTIDRQVPTEQGWQHYRALQHLGNTDVKFILFPGEAHGPRKYAHQRRKMVEELAWFDKYLFGTYKEKNESLKPASPLAAALKLASGAETPETVRRGDIAVGRFEVTRAQFAAFRPGYSYPSGTGSYPANDVSFADAKQYCKWLSAKTGKKFRLGSEKEMKPLLKPSKCSDASACGNTLDRWAGYVLNADDARNLAEAVKKLGPDVLLRPVGSFAGSGEDPLFDLDGNVAEWVVGADGTGKALGGSADRPADPKCTRKPAPGYIGFRVVTDVK